jgi:hypothetical protein
VHRRTQVIPDYTVPQKMRIVARNNASLTRPIAKIVKAEKTGTTTATITTDVPHGLTTQDLVQAYGTRDQTNFANLATATAVASIVSPMQFTVVWGAAVTASTFGGTVARVNGGQLLQGLVSNGNVQTIARTSNVVTLTTLTAVTGLLIGDYINVHAARNAIDGGDIGLDGPYRVRDIQTTTLALEPIGNAPIGGDVVSTNCGGVLIKRTDMRISSVRIAKFLAQRVEFNQRGVTDGLNALGTTIVNTPAVSQSGTWNVGINAGSNDIGRVQPGIPATPYIISSSAGTNAALVLTGTSGLTAIYATNSGAAPAYVKLYNKAIAPVVGTDIAAMILPIPAAVGGVPGVSPPLPCGFGFRFPLGLGVAITGGAADTDTTAVAAGQVKLILSRTT